MLSLVAVLLASTPHSTVQVQPSPGPLARLDWDKPVVCDALAPTKELPSGRYRVQCDALKRTCLAAPDMVLQDGEETNEQLARTHWCQSSHTEDKGIDEGWPVYRAIAEAQPGWYRDERGRVMQVNFDLTRRVWFGGSWSPRFGGGSYEQGTAHPEVGIATSWNDGDERELHRLRLLELGAWLGRDTRFEGTGLRFDSSARRETPPVRVTTFVGHPRRFDLDLNLTWGLELARFEALGGRAFLGLGEVDLVLDIWHSRDLESYLRVRAGPGVEMDLPTKAFAFRPAAAVEADFTLDENGFHHLSASVTGEKLFFEPQVDGRPTSPARLKARGAYEVILLAINDYPLTAYLGGRATWRDDVPGLTGWEVTADAGLRFSFWAPARHALSR